MQEGLLLIVERERERTGVSYVHCVKVRADDETFKGTYLTTEHDRELLGHTLPSLLDSSGVANEYSSTYGQYSWSLFIISL